MLRWHIIVRGIIVFTSKNLSHAEAALFWEIHINTIAEDALAPYVTRSSAAMYWPCCMTGSLSSMRKDFNNHCLLRWMGGGGRGWGGRGGVRGWGWGGGGFSKVGATLNHVGKSYLFMATTGDVWIIPSFWIWDYVLHVEHFSCVITNCGQHQWVIPSPLSIAFYTLLEENITRKLLSLSLDLFFKILLFQVAFLIFFSSAIFSPYFLLVVLLLRSVALFRSGN